MIQRTEHPGSFPDSFPWKVHVFRHRLVVGREVSLHYSGGGPSLRPEMFGLADLPLPWGGAPSQKWSKHEFHLDQKKSKLQTNPEMTNRNQQTRVNLL